jgi:hypothetical protein
MYCTYCGTLNAAGIKRCGQCGAELPDPGRTKAWPLRIPRGLGLGCLLVLAAFGIMTLAIILPQYRLYHLQITLSREAIVRSNMRTLRLTLDQYAAEFEQYPMTLETAGTDPAGQGVAYIAMTARRMQDPFDPLVPSVVVSPADPPDWEQIKPGQVVYVPLDTAGNRAQRYIIYGMGKDRPLGDVMRGGYGQ